MTSTGPADDLTGDWTGLYNYPNKLPPTPFEASLREHDGHVSGVTTEPDFAFGGDGGTMHAMIEGVREGCGLRFTKTYDDFERAPDVIHYEGRVQPGGDEISGRWTIPGVWSGTFLMIRAAGTEDEVAREAEETVR